MFRKILVAAAAIVAILFLACLLWPAREVSTVQSSQSVVRRDISLYSAAVSWYMHENGGILPAPSRTERQDVGEVRALFDEELLDEMPVPILDPWGNAYRLYLDVDGDGSVTVGPRRVKARLYMYSVGPNGVDDFGQGDDIGYSHDL